MKNRPLNIAELAHLQKRLTKLEYYVQQKNEFLEAYNEAYSMPKKVVKKNLAKYKRILAACALRLANFFGTPQILIICLKNL